MPGLQSFLIFVFLLLLSLVLIYKLLVVDINIEKKLRFVLFQDVGVLACGTRLEDTESIFKRVLEGVFIVICLLACSELHLGDVIPGALCQYQPVYVLYLHIHLHMVHIPTSDCRKHTCLIPMRRPLRE